MNNPIFVIGVGRSGTTLLQSMLNAHPQICLPPETHFLRFYLANKKYNNINLDDFLQLIDKDKYIVRLGLDLKQNMNPFLKNEKEFSLIEFYKDLMANYSINKGKEIWGDKDPRNIEYLPMINKYFPQAHIIHVIRDPRDVYLSRRKAEWSKGRNPLLHIFAYYVQNKKGRKEGRKYFGNNYYEIIYENLLEKPEKELKSLCDSLNIDYSDSMLNYGESAKQIVTEDEMQWKKESLGPLLKNNTGKWQGQLTQWEVALIEKLCIPLVRDLGYRKSEFSSGISFFKKFSLPFFDLVFRVLGKGYLIWKGKSNYGF